MANTAFEAGKIYRTGKNILVKLFDREEKSETSYPLVGYLIDERGNKKSFFESYTVEGTVWADGSKDRRDLVEECSEITRQFKIEAQKEAKLREALEIKTSEW